MCLIFANNIYIHTYIKTKERGQYHEFALFSKNILKRNRNKNIHNLYDFTKVFDCLNHNSLFHKLQKYGIAYNVIKSTYTESNYSIKTNFGITQHFISTCSINKGAL